MKINAKQIGFNRPFNLKPSVKIYEKANVMLIQTLKMQAAITKMQSLDPTNNRYADVLIDMLDKENTYIDSGLDFLKDILKLSPKQLEVVQDHIASAPALADYISYVIQRIKGYSENQIDLENKKAKEAQANQDPKK